MLTITCHVMLYTLPSKSNCASAKFLPWENHWMNRDEIFTIISPYIFSHFCANLKEIHFAVFPQWPFKPLRCNFKVCSSLTGHNVSNSVENLKLKSVMDNWTIMCQNHINLCKEIVCGKAGQAIVYDVPHFWSIAWKSLMSISECLLHSKQS